EDANERSDPQHGRSRNSQHSRRRPQLWVRDREADRRGFRWRVRRKGDDALRSDPPSRAARIPRVLRWHRIWREASNLLQTHRSGAGSAEFPSRRVAQSPAPCFPISERGDRPDMNTAIETYINSLFAPLPRTPDLERARLELLEMSEDKYQELMNSGISENEATGQVITEFGNLD